MFKRFLPLISRCVTREIGRGRINNVNKGRLHLAGTGSIRIQDFHVASRHHAKSKNIKKDKKKNTYVDENELNEWFDKDKLFADLMGPIEHFKKQLVEHTMLRSAQSAIENVKIEFEGSTYLIQDLAEIGKKNPKLYVLDFSIFPQTIPVVVEKLQKSHMNLNIQQDGNKLFIPIQKVTKEHREVLAKKAKSFFTNCKQSIRDVQMKYTKQLKAQESISEGDISRITNQLSTLGDKHIKMAEEILKTKEDELLNSEQ